MTDFLSFTITDDASGQVTTITVEEEEPAPPVKVEVDDPDSTDPPPTDTIEFLEYVCSKCGKSYKGLRCLQKHRAICGQPKIKKKQQQATKRRSDEEETTTTTTTSPDKTSDEDQRSLKTRLAGSSLLKVKARRLSEQDTTEDDSAGHNDSVAIEVLPAKIEEDDDPDEELCYCCEEPLKNAHMGHVRCKFCKISFHTYMGRDKHVINFHNSSERFRCNKCKVQCVNAKVLKKHLEHHLEFVCVECGTQFKRRYHLDRHKVNSKCMGVTKKEPHQCDVCKKTFLRLDNLRVHLRGHMGEETRPRAHQCQICEKSFFGASMLLIHVRSHTGERPYPCDLCAKAFPSNGALRKHRRVHTGEKPYECSYCHVKFTAKETLNRHLKTHTGKKSYKCEECGVSFIQRTQLKNHMFHHTGEDGHECPHCEEQFDNKASMTRHISSQHNLGEKCATCGAVFGCQQDLQNHEEAMHSTNKRFICEDCCLQFPKKSELLEHVAKCGGRDKMTQPVLSCKECGKVYKRHDLLVRHERTAHLDEVDGVKVGPKKKRGRPRKVVEVLEVVDTDEVFNQLKSNLVATFPSDEQERGELQMDTVEYRNERALKLVLVDILTGLLDEEVLRKMGWPKRGVMGTLEQVLQTVGAIEGGGDEEEDEEEEEDADTMTKLRNKMMTLLGKFIGKEYLNGLINNYSIDQILHYMAESVSK